MLLFEPHLERINEYVYIPSYIAFHDQLGELEAVCENLTYMINSEGAAVNCVHVIILLESANLALYPRQGRSKLYLFILLVKLFHSSANSCFLFQIAHEWSYRLSCVRSVR